MRSISEWLDDHPATALALAFAVFVALAFLLPGRGLGPHEFVGWLTN